LIPKDIDRTDRTDRKNWGSFYSGGERVTRSSVPIILLPTEGGEGAACRFGA
jgi:hypothetical protein